MPSYQPTYIHTYLPTYIQAAKCESLPESLIIVTQRWMNQTYMALNHNDTLPYLPTYLHTGG